MPISWSVIEILNKTFRNRFFLIFVSWGKFRAKERASNFARNAQTLKNGSLMSEGSAVYCDYSKADWGWFCHSPSSTTEQLRLFKAEVSNINYGIKGLYLSTAPAAILPYIYIFR